MAADFLESLRPLFDCLTDGFCVADTDGRLLYANAAAGALLGPAAKAVGDTSICDLLCTFLEEPHGIAATSCPLKVPHGTRDALTFKGRYRPTGRDLRLRCLRARLPSVERHLIVIEDVTDQAEKGRRQEEWRQMLAHDFRAPLTIMYGVLRAIADLGAGHALDRGDIELLESGIRNSRRLDELIESYLETTRLEDGELHVRAEAVAVDALIQGVVADEAETARTHGLELSAGPPSGLTAAADPDLLRRATLNLVGNALKFTPAGGHVRAEASRGDGTVLIRVSDDGPGISPRDLPRVFDRFYQGAHHKRGHGLGLGLTFCRAAMRAMGGEISVESTEGKGSAFTLSLPEAERPEVKP